MAYAPYGEEYNGSGTQDLAFTDQNQDTVKNGWSTNLYDFMFREYRTAHGRWSSPDPAGFAVPMPDVPQTWNRYAYALNIPTGLTDSTGLEWVCHEVWGTGAWLDTGNGAPVYTSSQALQVCYDIPDTVTLTGSNGGGNGQTTNGGGWTGGAGTILTMAIPLGAPKGCGEQLADMLNDINAMRAPGTSGSKGLAQRFSQILKGSHADSGHVTQFQQRQRNLQKKIDNYRNSGCGEPPVQVTSWANIPVASSWTPPNLQNFSIPPWVGPAAIITGAAACAIFVPGCLELEPALLFAP